MNPPYGGGGKMPDVVQEYVREKYEYKANYYVSFFEVCERLSRDAGRIGMLIPGHSYIKEGSPASELILSALRAGLIFSLSLDWVYWTMRQSELSEV